METISVYINFNEMFTFIGPLDIDPSPYFKYAGGKIWNGVLNNIQNAQSVEAFKYVYKKLNVKHRNTN